MEPSPQPPETATAARAKALGEAMQDSFLEMNDNLVGLVAAVKEESHQRSEKVDAIQRLTKVIIGLAVILLLATGYQVYTSAQSRATRNTQFEQSNTNQLRIEKAANVAGLCAVTAQGKVSVYEACMISHGFPLK